MERTKLSEFELIDSNESNKIEAIINANNENFCLLPFLRKADRITIEKSFLLVTMAHLSSISTRIA